MLIITEIFNNREISIFVWAVLLILFALSKEIFRESVIKLLQTFFNVLNWYLSVLIYVIFLVFIFYKIGLWDYSMIKDTIYWTFGSAFVLLINANNALVDKNHFTNIFRDCFKLIIIVEFISNLYAFNFFVEFVTIPVIFITFLVIELPNYKDDKILNRFFSLILTSYAIAVIIFSVFSVYKNFDSTFTFENLKSLLFNSFMTLFIVPYLYFFALYMAYESFFKRNKYILSENQSVYKFLKWELIKHCHINLNKVNMLAKKLHIYSSIKKEQITKEMNSILNV